MNNELPCGGIEAAVEPVVLARAAADAPTCPTDDENDLADASVDPAPASDALPALAASPLENPTTSGVGAAQVGPSDGDLADSDRSDGSPSDGDLEELLLPSLIQAPEPLDSGAELGPEERLRVVEHLGTRGRVNRYAAIWRQDDGQKIEVELREGPVDHAGLRREADILTVVQYAMLPHCFQAWVDDDRRYLAVGRLAGETLEQALVVGLPVDRTLSIIVQLTQVVRRLHQAGWALLGLTPADIVLGQPVRIGQLGHAGRIGEPPHQALEVAGYSAPELAYREAVTGKEDVYTLGAFFYRALTGHPLADSHIDISDLSAKIRLPGGPQLLADVLTPADERLDIDALYRRLLALKSRYAEQSLSLEVASATTLGLNPTRLTNEDSCAYAIWSRTGADGATETALLCVADGMGGMEAGEIASQTAIDVVMQGAARACLSASEDVDASPSPMIEPSDATSPVIRGMQGRPNTEGSSKAGGAARPDPVGLVQRAATAVHASAQGQQLGTTITCVVVQGGELTLAHVGDTRAYLLHDGVLTQLTADHSLVAAMVASGVITAEEARGHPDSNKVLRSLGSQRELPVGYIDGLQAAFGAPSMRLAAGDWLMLCSDGVWGTVEDREIQVMLTEALDCQRAASALIDRALQGGALDNATAVVARCVQRPVL